MDSFRHPPGTGQPHQSGSRNASTSRQRWRILRMQIHQQQEPCFGTDARYLCQRYDCPVRSECLTLRARHLL